MYSIQKGKPIHLQMLSIFKKSDTKIRSFAIIVIKKMINIIFQYACTGAKAASS